MNKQQYNIQVEQEIVIQFSLYDSGSVCINLVAAPNTPNAGELIVCLTKEVHNVPLSEDKHFYALMSGQSALVKLILDEGILTELKYFSLHRQGKDTYLQKLSDFGVQLLMKDLEYESIIRDSEIDKILDAPNEDAYIEDNQSESCMNPPIEELTPPLSKKEDYTFRVHVKKRQIDEMLTSVGAGTDLINHNILVSQQFKTHLSDRVHESLRSIMHECLKDLMNSSFMEYGELRTTFNILDKHKVSATSPIEEYGHY